VAAAYLLAKGYEIIARNWRTPQAEIDIVAARDGCCVFVEVRSKTDTDHGHPLETIRQQKRAQIIRAARLFVASENPQLAEFRFDVVAVTFNSDSDLSDPEIIHLENAFQTDF
jgi:putative endonuclease